jgi:Flp pilus assembly protein TadG
MRRLLRARRASATVEFAICGLTVLITMFVILDLGDLALVLSAMTYSSQEAVRQAAVQTSANLAGLGTSTSCLSQAQIVALFNSAMPSLLPAGSSSGTGSGAPLVQASWVQGSGTSNGTGTYLTLTARYNWVAPGMLRVVVPLTVSETQMVQGTSGTEPAQCS